MTFFFPPSLPCFVFFSLTLICVLIGDLPVIISCASLALADAGIMMFDIVTSVSVVCIDSKFLLLLLGQEICLNGSLH